MGGTHLFLPKKEKNCIILVSFSYNTLSKSDCNALLVLLNWTNQPHRWPPVWFLQIKVVYLGHNSYPPPLDYKSDAPC